MESEATVRVPDTNSKCHSMCLTREDSSLARERGQSYTSADKEVQDDLTTPESLRASDWWKFYSDPENHSFMTAVVAQSTSVRGNSNSDRNVTEKDALSVLLGGNQRARLSCEDMTVKKLVHYMRRFQASPSSIAGAVRVLNGYQRNHPSAFPSSNMNFTGAVLDPVEFLRMKRIKYVPAIKPEPVTNSQQFTITPSQPIGMKSGGAFRDFRHVCSDQELHVASKPVTTTASPACLSPLHGVQLDKELQQLHLVSQREKGPTSAASYHYLMSCLTKQLSEPSCKKAKSDSQVQHWGKRMREAEAPFSCRKQSSASVAASLGNHHQSQEANGSSEGAQLSQSSVLVHASALSREQTAISLNISHRVSISMLLSISLPGLGSVSQQRSRSDVSRSDWMPASRVPTSLSLLSAEAATAAAQSSKAQTLQHRRTAASSPERGKIKKFLSKRK